VITKKKNSDENNTVRRYRVHSKYIASALQASAITSDVLQRVIAGKFRLFGKSADGEIDQFHFRCHCSQIADGRLQTALADLS